ncbi:MAG: hypothetical protein NT080_00540 [Spirochaetes bacterium]|nr:hypothetical protein [Spirochaetota bacterium]
MNDGTMLPTAVFRRAFVAALAAFALSDVFADDLYVSTRVLADPTADQPAPAAELSAGGVFCNSPEAMLGVRLELEGTGGYDMAANGAYTSGGAELDASFGGDTARFVMLAGISGGIQPDVPAWTTPGLRARFIVDGPNSSIMIQPGVFVQYGGDEPRFGVDGLARLSVAAGDFILKPECEVSWTEYDSGTREFVLMPKVAASWYPGFPMTVSMDSGWKRTFDEDGAATDTLLGGFWAITSIGSVSLASVDVSFEIGADTWAADAEAELAFVVLADGDVVLSLPVGFAYSRLIDGTSMVSLSAGVKLEF